MMGNLGKLFVLAVVLVRPDQVHGRFAVQPSLDRSKGTAFQPVSTVTQTRCASYAPTRRTAAPGVMPARPLARTTTEFSRLFRRAGRSHFFFLRGPAGRLVLFTSDAFTVWLFGAIAGCLVLTTTWPLSLVLCPVAGGSPPLDGLVDVEKIGLPPRGTTGTQIPLCTGATGRPPLPPF